MLNSQVNDLSHLDQFMVVYHGINSDIGLHSKLPCPGNNLGKVFRRKICGRTCPHIQLLNTLEDNAKELENSIQSERILVDEFTKIIKNVENCVSLTDNIDQVLFSSLDEAETPAQYESASENSANGN